MRGFKVVLFVGRTGDGCEDVEDWGEPGGESAREGWIRVGCAFGLSLFLEWGLFATGLGRVLRACGCGVRGGLLLRGGARVEVPSWDESCVDWITGNCGSAASSSAGMSN